MKRKINVANTVRALIMFYAHGARSKLLYLSKKMIKQIFAFKTTDNVEPRRPFSATVDRKIESINYNFHRSIMKYAGYVNDAPLFPLRRGRSLS